jgi:hypothetical protein
MSNTPEGTYPEIGPDIPEQMVQVIIKPPVPKASYGSDPLLQIPAPREFGTIGVKWLGPDGKQYGDAISLPPRVFAEVMRQLREL